MKRVKVEVSWGWHLSPGVMSSESVFEILSNVTRPSPPSKGYTQLPWDLAQHPSQHDVLEGGKLYDLFYHLSRTPRDKKISNLKDFSTIFPRDANPCLWSTSPQIGRHNEKVQDFVDLFIFFPQQCFWGGKSSQESHQIVPESFVPSLVASFLKHMT